MEELPEIGSRNIKYIISQYESGSTLRDIALSIKGSEKLTRLTDAYRVVDKVVYAYLMGRTP